MTDLTPVRTTGEPAWKQIADQLRLAIAAGDFEPGGKLPSEVELTEAFGVARMTVRQGLQRLRTEGLIVSHQGKGVYVVPQHRVSHEERTVEALVRDDSLPGVHRVIFIRLGEAGALVPADSLTAEDAHVDVDEHGKVIGVTVFLQG